MDVALDAAVHTRRPNRVKSRRPNGAAGSRLMHRSRATVRDDDDQILDDSPSTRDASFSGRSVHYCDVIVIAFTNLHAAASVEAAADAAMLDPGSRTADLGGSAKTQVFTKAVIGSMRE